ncbi:hypothetical protein ABS71_01400 [bacterium SCN 62-11]|nr:hypothetical protein [Candidatus Eremiobacteraeota bacterium]ODT78972.1 MAG: hypothetical protein ABS71_01400 [bacterium SCN 62-11]
MSDVDGLIRALHQEGVLTSEGTFTISLERAAATRKKLLQVSPAWPWLQLIREAYRLGASWVHLDTRSSFLGFRFACGPQPQWWAAVEWLAQREVGKPSSLLLAEVLLALIGSGAERLELVLTGEFDNAKLTWSGKADHLDLWGWCPEPTQLHLTVIFPKVGWFQAGPDYPQRVRAEIQQRCRHSPVPIKIGDQLVNDANWTTLPGLSYLVPDVRGYEFALEEVQLGGGFLAPSTRVFRGREFLVNDYRMVTDRQDVCNGLLLSLRGTPQDTITRLNLHSQMPTGRRFVPLHPQLQGNTCVGQDFLVTDLDCFSQSLSRNCGYPDLQREPAPYLKVQRRLIFPLRAPFVGQLCVIQQGVALQATDCDLGIPGCVALVQDDRLVSDADDLKAVRDGTWETIRLELRQRFRELGGVLKSRLAEPGLSLPVELRKDLEVRLQERFS